MNAEMKKRSVRTPILVGFAIVGLMVIMAATDMFQPLIQFIHTGEITLMEAFWCFLATALAFGLTAKFLIMLGGYFLPKAEERRANGDRK